MEIEMKNLLLVTGVALSVSSAGYAIEAQCPIAADVASKMNMEYKGTSTAREFIQDALSDTTISNNPRATIAFPSLTLTEKKIGTHKLCKYTSANGLSISFYIDL